MQALLREEAAACCSCSKSQLITGIQWGSRSFETQLLEAKLFISAKSASWQPKLDTPICRDVPLCAPLSSVSFRAAHRAQLDFGKSNQAESSRGNRAWPGPISLAHHFGNRCTTTNVVDVDVDRYMICPRDAESRDAVSPSTSLRCDVRGAIYNHAGPLAMGSLSSLPFPHAAHA